MHENRKTTSGPKLNNSKGLATAAKIKRPVLKAKSRGGAPKGNANAFKTGFYTAQSKDLRRRVRVFRHRVDAVLAALKEGALSKPR